jgi:hypothetical protein
MFATSMLKETLLQISSLYLAKKDKVCAHKSKLILVLIGNSVDMSLIVNPLSLGTLAYILTPALEAILFPMLGSTILHALFPMSSTIASAILHLRQRCGKPYRASSWFSSSCNCLISSFASTRFVVSESLRASIKLLIMLSMFVAT